jgi:hypothetical protein
MRNKCEEVVSAKHSLQTTIPDMKNMLRLNDTTKDEQIDAGGGRGIKFDYENLVFHNSCCNQPDPSSRRILM